MYDEQHQNDLVTPLAGVRIETFDQLVSLPNTTVTPLAGVRIETLFAILLAVTLCHTSRRCAD